LARFRFNVLGPLRAEWDGRPIPIRGVQQRTLLILLLVHRDRGISADALVEALFDGPEPNTGLKRLHVTVSRLRQMLLTESGETLISTEAGGYRLDASRVDLDVDRFESAISEARTLFAARRGDVALGVIDEALSLWRGPPLADVQFAAFAQPEVTRLEELHRMALELRLEVLLARGMHDVVLPEVEALSQEHPLHEGFRAKLMLALYRTGRHVDALASYREGSRLLADELGLEPGPELRRLEQAILTHSPDLELSPTAVELDEPLPLPSLLGRVAQRAFAGRRRPLHVIDELWRGVPDRGPRSRVRLGSTRDREDRPRCMRRPEASCTGRNRPVRHVR
jgi:DNA-binding SARP family transcriptional activator